MTYALRVRCSTTELLRQSGIGPPPLKLRRLKKIEINILISLLPARRSNKIFSDGRELNPQPSAWEADVLPLNYHRIYCGGGGSLHTATVLIPQLKK